MSEMQFPELKLSDWRPTRDTLHKYALVLGEIRGALTPKMKHWWHINLRPGVTGLVTPPIQASASSDSFAFEMTMDFVSHALRMTSSAGHATEIKLTGQSVSAFCAQALDSLALMGIEVEIDRKQFSDTTAGAYDTAAADRFWRALGQIAMVFTEFKAGMREESSPLSLWPHHFDMAFAWFSGRQVPDTDPTDPEYADEQMSFGFSTGDEGITDAYFYISAYPMPDELKNTPPPAEVSWHAEGWHGALLMYDSLVKSSRPKELLRDYLQTYFRAGKRLMR